MSGRKGTQAQALADILAADDRLSAWARAARRLHDLDAVLASRLPPGIAAACRAGAICDGVLTIECSNTAAASHVRQLAPSLLTAFVAAGAGASRLVVRMRTDIAYRPPRPPKATLSATALSALDSLRDTLPAGGLRAALDRLTRRYKR